MPRVAVENNSRISLRIAAADKATILRVAALAQTDMTSFIARTAVEAAQAMIDRSERIVLSRRDSLRLLELLENPPEPTAKMLAAIEAMPKLR